MFSDEEDDANLERDAEDLLRYWERKRLEKVQSKSNSKIDDLANNIANMHIQAVSVLASMNEKTKMRHDQKEQELLNYNQQNSQKVDIILQRLSSYHEKQNREHVEDYNQLKQKLEYEKKQKEEKEKLEIRKRQQLETEKLKEQQKQLESQNKSSQQNNQTSQQNNQTSQQNNQTSQQKNQNTLQNQNILQNQNTLQNQNHSNISNTQIQSNPDSVSPNALLECSKIIQSAQWMKKSFENLLTLPDFPEKKRTFFRRINLATQQYSADANQVITLISTIKEILTDSERISQEMLVWAQDLMCQKIIEQAEIQISAHLESSIPLAMIIVAVSASRVSLINLLLGHIYQSCPLAIPRYIEKKSNQSESEFKTAQRYQSGESETSFLSRMNGIIALYAAITCTQTRGRNPYGLDHAWTWLARLLNMKPQPKITASVLYTFLRIAAPSLHQTYQRQFVKVFQFIMSDFIPLIPESPEKKTLILYCEQVGKEGLKPISNF